VNPYVHGAGDIDCRTIDMFSIENLNTGIIAYEAGDVDFLPDMSVSYEPELVALSKNGIRADIISPLVFGTYYYHFNCRAELAGGRLNPFADARLRRAFALAVNKQAIVSYVTRRGEPVAGTLIPPGMIPGYESPNGLEFDPVEARRLLADAGFAGGSGLGPVEILYNTDFSHERIVQVLAEQWRRNLGVEIRLKGLETKTFGAQKADGQFMIARGGWYGDYLDPTTFLDTFVTGDGNNDCGFSNERFDELMSRADDELDAERRLAMLSRAERLLVEEELPVVPLFVFPNTMAIKPHVGGLYPNPRLMFLFRHVFLSK
jgi:oligopeptide transport system substrate-binding protein